MKEKLILVLVAAYLQDIEKLSDSLNSNQEDAENIKYGLELLNKVYDGTPELTLSKICWITYYLGVGKGLEIYEKITAEEHEEVKTA